MLRWRALICATGLVIAAAGTSSGQAPAKSQGIVVPSGLPPISHPADNPATEAKIELGRQLYFDPRLSIDDTVSCASCHDPKKGWSNGEQFATGVKGQKGGRNAPSIINSAYSPFQFWDGRAMHLEGQALGPIQNPIEMALKLDDLIVKLNKIPGYKKQFQAVFKTDATPDAIAKSIAAFERTVLSGGAPYDKSVAGDTSALSPAAQRGMKVFFNKGHCSACHSGPSFTDQGFHNIGVGMDAEKPDLGRFVVTKVEGDKGSFKTPTLREIARSGPYMHDGRFTTLAQVVDFYDRGGTPNPQLDEEIYPLKLTAEEKADLVKFLEEGLASPNYPLVAPPKLPE